MEKQDPNNLACDQSKNENQAQVRSVRVFHTGLYLTFLGEGGGGGGGAKLMSEVENMATLQSFTLGGSGDISLRKFWCNLRHTEKHRFLICDA